MEMKTKVTLAGGEEKWVDYLMKIQQSQFQALYNFKEVLDVEGKCTRDKIETQGKWGEFINELVWCIGELIKDAQMKALVTRNEKPELKTALERLFRTLQKAAKVGYHDENLNAILKPYTLTPQMSGNVTLGLKPYNNSKLMHILIQLLDVTNPAAPWQK